MAAPATIEVAAMIALEFHLKLILASGGLRLALLTAEAPMSTAAADDKQCAEFLASGARVGYARGRKKAGV